MVYSQVKDLLFKSLVKRCGSVLFYLSIVEKMIQVWVFHHVSEREKEYPFLMRNLDAKKGMRILDVGCSGSLVCHWLVSKGCEVHGVDVRPYKEIPRGMAFYQADIMEKLPFPDDYFDRIVCISTIEHVGLGGYGDIQRIKGDFRAMDELKRVLKMKGRIVLTTPYGYTWKEYQPRDAYPHTAWRVYDKNMLRLLIMGLAKIREEYFVHTKRWIKVRESVASRTSQGLVCLALEKPEYNV